jgi:uncharacterized membrane protein YphA (DoxX/SURF4 family)
VRISVFTFVFSLDKIDRNMIDGATLHLARWAIGLVWFYQGFWSKVLGRTPRHAQVVEAAPMFTTLSAHVFLLALGWFETLIGISVVTGFQPRTTAITELVLLVVMNAGGLLWASKIIPDPAAMIFQNLTFAMLIWICR